MISFVGAGPGAADLITLRGAERLAHAEVVIWASSLVPEAVLQHCAADATVHDSATMTLEDVIAVYGAHPERTRIARLHSGDPSIYGAIFEQIDWCRSMGRAYEIVPGVSSLAGAAAALGQELTQPGVAQSVVLTRLGGRTQASMPPGESVAAFAAHRPTLAVFLSAARPEELADELLAPGSGYDPGTPAAIVVRATWPDERIIRTTVGDLAGDLRATGATMTVLVLVGDALADDPTGRRSHLYAPGYSTAYRLRSRPGSTAGRPSARRRPPT
jgi:precorrin-4/cobalt-precorrin-4 C11-methyltransferase